MATKGIKIFFILSIVFYLIVVFYLVFSIFTIRTEEYSNSLKDVENYNTILQSSYSLYNTLATEHFFNKTQQIFDKDKTIAGIIIYSQTNGPEYIKTRQNSLISNYPDTGASSDWKPVINSGNPFIKIIESEVYFSEKDFFNITYVFNLVDRSLIFPVLRNALSAVLLHILFLIVFIAVRNVPAAPGTVKTSIDGKIADPINSSDNFSEITAESDPKTEKVVSPGMYSDRSGLVWAHFLPEKLEAELKRSASFDQDSCLAFISIDHPSGFIPYKNISKLIVDHFKYKDLAFESGESSFSIIIPDKDIDEGLQDIEKFRKSFLEKFPDTAYVIHAGLTSRNSRLLSEKRMIHEAKSALTRAKTEPAGTTISFRTDLNKYREYIASSM